MRSTADIHNPLLQLPAVHRIQSLPPEARDALKALLLDMRDQAQAKGDAQWKRKKALMAAYYKVLAVYFLHMSRLCRDPAVPLLQRIAAE